MSNDENGSNNAPYAIGYGRPPKHTRFRKGQSGNPGGRRRNAFEKRAKKMMMDEAYRSITVRDGDRTRRMPAYQAVLRSQFALAAKGDGPAQRAILRSIQQIEDDDMKHQAALLKQAAEYQAEL